MAYETGTASNATDLFNKLITFLTTNSDLVAAGQTWSVLRRDTFTAEPKTDFVELKGTGLAGSDNIYVQLNLFVDSASDTYAVRVLGSQAWTSSVSITRPDAQPGSCSATGAVQVTAFFLRMPLFGTSTPYWFIANGRRFIVIAKVGSYWGSLYAGLFLPYGTPSQYAYPLFVGANTGFSDKYSSTDTQTVASSFWRSTPTSNYNYTAAILKPGGTWQGINYVGNAQSTFGQMFPYTATMTGVIINPDGTFPLFPMLLYAMPSRALGWTVFGELDGVACVPGFSLSAGDTITQGGDTYIVSQSATNNTQAYFAAIKLA